MSGPSPARAVPRRGLLDDDSVPPATSWHTEAIPVEARPAALHVIACEVAACTRCQVLVHNRTKTVFGSGDVGAALCFVGEAPGADEDIQGLPFVGRAGQLLTDIIERGMKLKRADVYICNVLKCRPPDNRAPEPDEAENCRGYLERQLEILQPRYICCLGAWAARTLLRTSDSVGKLRGKVHHFRGAKLVCTYHPAYLLRNPAAKKQTWEDIQLLMREMGLPLGS